MRLVVCLCAVVTRLKDGSLSRATGELPGLVVGPLSQGPGGHLSAPSEITALLRFHFSTYVSNFIMH